MTSTDQKVSVFEVFKMKEISREEIQAVPLEQAQKKFIVFAPVRTAEDLAGAGAVGTFPLPTHTVVDRDSYKQMVVSNMTRNLDEKIRSLKAAGDQKVHALMDSVVARDAHRREAVLAELDRVRAGLPDACHEALLGFRGFLEKNLSLFDEDGNLFRGEEADESNEEDTEGKK